MNFRGTKSQSKLFFNLLLIILVITLHFSPNIFGNRLDQYLLFLFVPIIFSFRKPKRFLFPKLALIPIYLILCFFLLSNVISFFIFQSHIYLKTDVLEYLRYIELFLYSLVTVNFLSKNNFKSLILVLLICFIIVNIIGILQLVDFKSNRDLHIISFLSKYYPYFGEATNLKVDFPLKMGLTGRITSTFDGQPLFLGDYLSLVTPIVVTFALFLNKDFYIRTLSFLGSILGIICLIFTYSRGSILSFLISLIVIIFYLFREKKFSLKLPFFFLILIIGVIYLLFRFNLYETFVSKILLETLMEFQNKNIGRLSYWPELITKIKSSFIVGFGFSDNVITDSQYLLVLFKSGIIGLVIFVGVNIYIIYTILKRLKFYREEPLIYSFHIGFLASLYGWLVAYIFHPVWQTPRVINLFFIFLGLLDFLIIEQGNRRGE